VIGSDFSLIRIPSIILFVCACATEKTELIIGIARKDKVLFMNVVW
jgi:hypothetical protein